MFGRRREPQSPAQQIVLAASARARVELLISQMENNLQDLREIVVEGKPIDDRPE